MNHYLLDSDVIIWCLRGRKDVVDLVKELHQEGLPGCSTMSVLEVQIGVRPGEEEDTSSFLNALSSYPVDIGVANQASLYIREWKKKGETLDFVDAIIAGICKIHELTLVTFNATHFPMEDISLYRSPRS